MRFSQPIIFLPNACVHIGFCLLLLGCYVGSCSVAADRTDDNVANTPDSRPKRYITKAQQQIVIDGNGNDVAWQRTHWRPINERWVGEPTTKEDFGGKFKALWSDSLLYILAEIKDDTLIDAHTDELARYGNNDCLILYIDEDGSGGNHQYNHQAFSYHVTLDGKVTDIDTDSSFIYLTDHLMVECRTRGTTSVWEVGIRLFDPSYQHHQHQQPIALSAHQTIGFMVAYSDNDYSTTLEHVFGSEKIAGKEKNSGLIDADVFGKWILIK